jgi:hypothetical protein
MTTNERAAQIWSVLALAAHNRQVLTHNMVARITGIARVGLGQCLEPIQSYCLVKGLSPLTILVVSEKWVSAQIHVLVPEPSRRCPVNSPLPTVRTASDLLEAAL